MKTIHIITGLSTGGAERALFNLLNGGLSEHFNSHVISLRDEGTVGPQIRALGVPVTALAIRGVGSLLPGLLKLRRVIREFSPDLIQGWMYHGNLAASLACTFATARPALIWNIRHSLYGIEHEKWMTQQVIRVNRYFSNSPDTLLYNSQLSLSQHERFGFSAQKGMVIPNGIDVNRFHFLPESQARMRIDLGIPEYALVVGHVARLHPMKDHPTFLRAAADIAARYSNTYFILSGRGVSSLEKTLVALLPAKVRDRFHFLDERADIPELMSAMDIFCLSSAWGEAFPNVLGEAMASGLPCVATDVGDSAMIIGDTGIVVPPRDAGALTHGMERLLMMSLNERKSLAVHARNRICSNYTLKLIVEKYAVLYEQSIHHKKKAV